MARIFISYKRVDYDKVLKIKNQIELALGEKCWFDLDGIESSAQFASKICKAIDTAEIILFMHSKQHLFIDFENDWTIKELTYAHAKKKRVHLIKLDDAPLDNIFLMEYGAKNNTDSTNQIQMQNLFKDLRGWLGMAESEDTKQVESAMTSRKLCNSEFGSVDNIGEAKNQIQIHKLFNGLCSWLGLSESTELKLTESIMSAEELYRLGDDYRYGRSGKRIKYKKAVKYYKMAAELGHVDAQTSLGYCLEIGQGVKQDYTEAVKWYRKAAELGSAFAQLHLGNFLQKGLGVKKDWKEAEKWYQKAAEQGNNQAINALKTLKKCIMFADIITKLNEKK